MHLIESLAAGIQGAGNGTVGIYRRGTSLRVAIYEDFEAGDGSTTPTADLTLDANGGRVVYVNELVNCIVRDDSGTVIREFVSGVNASAVECITDSFTGTDYATGQTGVSKPLTLQAILDLWDGSAGTDDFNILVGGVSRTLAAAFTAFEAVYNVKDPTFGAVGDGSNNDTTAINAAITAAAVTGGTVYFPPGTYRITSTLVVTHAPTKTVNLRGAGQATTTIRMEANLDAISSTSTGTTIWSISDLSVILSLNTANDLIDLANSMLVLTRCTIGNMTFQAGGAAIRVAASAAVVAFACNISQPSVGVPVITSAGRLALIANVITCGSGAAGTTYLALTGQSLSLANSFVASGLTSGSLGSILGTLTGGPHVIVGNDFGNTGGGTTYPWDCSGSAADLFDLGNKVGTGYLQPNGLWQVPVSGSAHAGSVNLSRQVRRGIVLDNTAALSLQTREYGTYEVRRTAAGAQTVTPTVPPGPGLDFTIVYTNDQAASVALTMGGISAPAGLGGPFTVNANRQTVLFLRSFESTAAGGGAGSYRWLVIQVMENSIF